MNRIDTHAARGAAVGENVGPVANRPYTSIPRADWSLLTIAAVIVLALAAACGAAGPQPTAAVATPAPSPIAATAPAALAPSGPTLGGQQRAGDLLAWLTSKPASPVRGTAEMDAYLIETGGQPITDAKVTFDTDMTNMSHGPNLVTAQPVGNGHYSGQVRFSMPGPWRVIAVIERPGREPVKLRFEFRVN